MTENRALILKFGVLTALLMALYFPELRSMVITWSDKKEYSHGFLIPLISGYVVWLKRDKLRGTPIICNVKGLFMLIAGIVLLIIGNISFESSIRQYSFILSVMGLVYFMLGIDMYKTLLFPVGYLLFMIPLPYLIMNNIAINLRLIDAKVTYNALRFLGIPILREGVNLELPNMSLVVADLCTGILSLVAITALAVFYAYITQKNFISRVILVLLAIPIAIFSNMLRLIMTVGLAYFYGERILSKAIHEFHGTVNFFITVFLLIVAGKFIHKMDIKISKKALS